MGKRIVLGVTGSVAASLTPKLVTALIKTGNEVRIVVTDPALYFFPEKNLSRSKTELMLTEFDLDPVHIWKDHDEWPASGYHKNDPVRHIEFRTWADLLLIAPLSANTLAKIAFGQCDNFLTCIARAWPKNKPFVIAPAMNTEMWEDPITQTHLEWLMCSPNSFSQGYCRRFCNLEVVQPIKKTLACGDIGNGAMANIDTIIETVNSINRTDPD